MIRRGPVVDFKEARRINRLVRRCNRWGALMLAVLYALIGCHILLGWHLLWAALPLVEFISQLITINMNLNHAGLLARVNRALNSDPDE